MLNKKSRNYGPSYLLNLCHFDRREKSYTGWLTALLVCIAYLIRFLPPVEMTRNVYFYSAAVCEDTNSGGYMLNAPVIVNCEVRSNEGNKEKRREIFAPFLFVLKPVRYPLIPRPSFG
jgi:hypothetical protein